MCIAVGFVLECMSDIPAIPSCPLGFLLSTVFYWVTQAAKSTLLPLGCWYLSGFSDRIWKYTPIMLWSISSAWGCNSSSGHHTQVSQRTKRRLSGAWKMNAWLIICSKYATVTAVPDHTVTTERRQGNERLCGSSHHIYPRSRVGRGFGHGLTWHHCCFKKEKKKRKASLWETLIMVWKEPAAEFDLDKPVPSPQRKVSLPQEHLTV